MVHLFCVGVGVLCVCVCVVQVCGRVNGFGWVRGVGVCLFCGRLTAFLGGWVDRLLCLLGAPMLLHPSSHHHTIDTHRGVGQLPIPLPRAAAAARAPRRRGYCLRGLRVGVVVPVVVRVRRRRCLRPGPRGSDGGVEGGGVGVGGGAERVVDFFAEAHVRELEVAWCGVVWVVGQAGRQGVSCGGGVLGGG